MKPSLDHMIIAPVEASDASEKRQRPTQDSFQGSDQYRGAIAASKLLDATAGPKL